MPRYEPRVDARGQAVDAAGECRRDGDDQPIGEGDREAAREASAFWGRGL